MGKLSITGGKPVRTKPFSDWPIYSRQEERALQKVLASRTWGGYPFPNTIADRFAQKFAKFHGAKYGLAVSNGTVAIQVALKAAGIGPGDEVIVPAYTWEGTVGPVLLLNAVRAPPRHLHGDPTSLAPHERLTDLAVVPREKPHTGAAAREQPRDSPVTERGGPSSPAWPSDQSRDLSPNASGGLTPLSPPSELQEIPVATREQSGVLCFHSR